MLDSERNTNETDDKQADGGQPGAAAVPAAVFQAPQVLFQPPAQVAAPETTSRPARGTRGSRAAKNADTTASDETPAAEPDTNSRAERSGAAAGGSASDSDSSGSGGGAAAGEDSEDGAGNRRRSRRRNSRSRSKGDVAESADASSAVDAAAGSSADVEAGSPGTDGSSGSSRSSGASGSASGSEEADAEGTDDDADESGDTSASGRRRRRKRRRGSDGDVASPDDPPDTVVHVREAHNPADDVRAIKGSTRLEAKKQRRREGRESGRRRPPVVTESEFLARRESVERTMAVRQRGDRTQIAVLEDGVLVEHYVNRTTHQSYVGNVYLGKVQNVLPSMEAAFVDIGKGRNAVLYAGEVNFDASGLEGQTRRIESALKSGQSVLVQATKDPVGHKGARLTSQVS
ncbi:MAG: ribonuclease E/G, partial [Trebonia sp.]